jgi:caspase 7
MADVTGKTQVDAQSEVNATTQVSPVSLALEEYKSTYPRRGRCVVINNWHFNYNLTKQQDRDGTEVDAENVAKTFERLGFDVIVHTDLTVTDMSITLREASEDSDYHETAECFVCVILSHGEEGVIYGTNGTIKIDSLINRFKGDVCQSLAGKPKLFFIQACRGRRYDFGVTVGDTVDSVDSIIPAPAPKVIPVEADLMVAYSVVPGYFSWRNNVDGSWFIQALCRVLSEHGQSMDLTHMMTLVSKVVAYEFQSCTDTEFTSGMKSVPWVVSTLTKLVYFRPNKGPGSVTTFGAKRF